MPPQSGRVTARRADSIDSARRVMRSLSPTMCVRKEATPKSARGATTKTRKHGEEGYTTKTPRHEDPRSPGDRTTKHSHSAWCLCVLVVNSIFSVASCPCGELWHSSTGHRRDQRDDVARAKRGLRRGVLLVDGDPDRARDRDDRAGGLERRAGGLGLDRDLALPGLLGQEPEQPNLHLHPGGW